MNKEAIIAIPADPTDRDDGAVSAGGLERGLVGRRIRKVRTRLGLSQVEFAERYEIGRTLPPAAVRAYLRVIEAEPEHVAQLLQAV